VTIMSDSKIPDRPPATPVGEDPPREQGRRRSKFGVASEGWEAYATWLDRVRQQPGPISRQAVIAKSLYSVSSYKTWAGKARGAFDKPK
jgi:hypothetical protein